MVVPGRPRSLVVLASVLLIFGGIAVSVLTEHTYAGVGITIFGFVLPFAEAALNI